MKRIIIIFIIVANCHILSAQENLVVFFTDAVTDSIPIYCNDTDMEIYTKIKEDLQKENWHDVELLDISNSRYRVRIIPINETNTLPIEGWLDKRQCGVWLWGKNGGLNLWTFCLYDTLGQLEPSIKVTDNYIDGFEKYTNNKAVPVLDYIFYRGVYWIKTEVFKDKKRIVGWTTDYCPNIYGSCN